MEIVPDKNMPAPTKAAGPTSKKSEDLFSAHDFDIKIDLEVPLPRKLFAFQAIDMGAYYFFHRQPCDGDAKSGFGRQGYWSSQILEPRGLQEKEGAYLNFVFISLN